MIHYRYECQAAKECGVIETAVLHMQSVCETLKIEILKYFESPYGTVVFRLAHDFPCGVPGYLVRIGDEYKFPDELGKEKQNGEKKDK